MATESIKVFIVDDDEYVRESTRDMLSFEDGIEVIGEAENGLSAIEKIRILKPDVVLMDIKMPVMDGLTATRQLRRELPHIPIVIVTGKTDIRDMKAAVEAGVSGFLVKPVSSAGLAEGVERAYRALALTSRTRTSAAVQNLNPRNLTVPSSASVAPIEADILIVLRTLTLNWWIIVLTTVLGILTSIVVSELQTPIYEAYTSVIVSPRPDPGDASLYGMDVLDINVLGTYVQILSSRTVLKEAYTDLAVSYDMDLLETAEIEVLPIENSMMAVVKVRSENPELARDLANEIAAQAMQKNPVGMLDQTYPIATMDSAELPTEPLLPNKRLSILLGAAGGIILGFGLAYLRATITNTQSDI